MYAGTEYLLVETIAKSLNFHPVFIEPSDNRACFKYTQVMAPTIVGYCKMLKEKIVALAGFPDYESINSLEHFHTSPSYYSMKQILVSAHQQVIKQGLAPSEAISMSLLIPLLVSILAVAISLSIIQRFMPDGRGDTFSGILFNVISLVCLEAIQTGPLNDPNKIILGVWMVCSFIVISLIFGEITSMTAAPKIEGMVINSFDDMKLYDVSWIVWPLQKYDDAVKILLPKLAKRRKEMFFRDGLQFVLDNPTEYVFITPKEPIEPLIQMYFWAGKGQSPFHFSPPLDGFGFPQANMVILQRKDSPYRHAIDKAVSQVIASGIFRFKFASETLKILPKFKGNENSNSKGVVEAKKLTMTIGHLLPSLMVIS